MSQLYGRGREESYTPSHGSGQNVYLVARASRPDETYQANKKPVVFNYYPSGKTAGPQRHIAEVQTVSRGITSHPVAVMEPKKDYPTHVDGQSRRDDEFVTKLQDAAMRANAGKLLGINLDQVQGDQVIFEDGVSRNIQPSDYHGNSAIRDGWSMQPTSIDENNPKRVAELFNKVSNWRGVNGHDRGRSSDTYDGWNNNPGGRYGYNYPRKDHGGSSGWKPSHVYQDYDQVTGYAGDTQSNPNYGNSHYGGYGSHGKPDDSYTGRNNNPQAPLGGRSYNDQGENYAGSSVSKQRPSTLQGYSQTTHYGGDTRPSSINGSNGNSDNMVSGNHGRLDGGYTRRNSPQLASRAGSGYTGQTKNLNGSNGLNTPLSTQQDYDDRPISYGGDTHKKPSNVKGYHSDSEDSSYGDQGRLGAPRAGSGYTDQTEKLNGSSGRNKPLSIQAPRAGGGYTGQTENLKGSSGLNKPLSTQQGYDQPIGYGGDIHKYPSGMNGTRSNSEDEGYGNQTRVDDSLTKGTNNPQAPQARIGYTGQAENFKGNSGLNKPLSTQQGYDQPVSYRGDTSKNPSSMSGNYVNSEGKGYGNCAKPDYNERNNNPQAPQGRYNYNKTGVDYNGGNGDGDGVNTRRKPINMINTTKRNKPEYEAYGNGYNSSSGPNTMRPAGNDISSKQAAQMYKGSFV